MSDPLATNSDAANTSTQDDGSDRRSFIKQGLLLGGSLVLGNSTRGRAARHNRYRTPKQPPNILVIMVDQLRAPMGLQSQALFEAQMPNLAALRRRSVDFQRHFTASNDCSPSRSTLLTGLYTHQTGCMITGRSKLDPGFPTWGTLLREIGYQTAWWGKWHLNPHANASLEPYGFSGGTYPSPNGSPGQGSEVDPLITTQFAEWFRANSGLEPWCATVSFVNPHDIAWWYRFTTAIPDENSPAQLISGLPANFETPQQLLERAKPAVQRSLQDTAARSFGSVPFDGSEAVEIWSSLINTYLLLQSKVDSQIGVVLDTLASRPGLAANTVVLFTSDHGEYGGAHGLRGKGAGAYEEAIRVPLYVCDPRGPLSAAVGTPRHQLTSSVDVAPLLLSIATGSGAWRNDSHYAHLAARHDLAAICRNPNAPGRPWVLHATDEDVTEFASAPYAAGAPRHVIALRTPSAKLGVYSNWAAGSIAIGSAGQESELYDYGTPLGAAEVENVASSSALEQGLYETLTLEAIPGELRAALPGKLQAAQARGLANYRAVEKFEDGRVQSHQPSPLGSEDEQVSVVVG